MLKSSPWRGEKPEVMSFDRAKFDAIVSEKSPLTSAQFDTMLGNVTADSKAIAWAHPVLAIPRSAGSLVDIPAVEESVP